MLGSTARPHDRTTDQDHLCSSPLTLAGRQVIFGNHLGQMTTLNSDTGALIHRDQGQGEIWTAAAG